MRVFVADDSSIFRKMLVASIAELGNVEVVGHAEHALEAIEGIARLNPDIVILDIRLKSGTGIDILHAIKRNMSASPIAIVLTNFPYEQYRKVCINLGADYFFHKATEFSEFVTTLRGLLPSSSASKPTDHLQQSFN